MRRATAAAIVAPAVLAACATGVRAPRPDEIARATEGRASVVLVRLQATTGREATLVLKPTLRDRLVGGWAPWALRTAALDAGAEVEVTAPPPSPSVQAAHDGWVLLTLPPGAYWLSIAPSDAWQAAGRFVPVPEFLLDIRGGEPVLYAGTIAFAQTSEGEPPPVSVLDQSDDARRMVARELPKLSGRDVITRLVEPYGRRLPPEAIHGLIPMGLGTVGVGSVGGPAWFGRSFKLWLTPAGALIYLGTQIDPRAYVGFGLIALGIGYVPVGLLGGAIHGAVLGHAYDPCVAELAKRLRETPPAEWLSRPIADAFIAHLHEVPLDVAGDAVAAQSRVRSVLLAGPTRFDLREVKRGEFAVEIAFRARLWDVSLRRWVYDRSFSYGPAPVSDGRPYETSLPGTPPTRTMSAYCPPGGWDVVLAEFEQASRVFVDELKRDLGWESAAPLGDTESLPDMIRRASPPAPDVAAERSASVLQQDIQVSVIGGPGDFYNYHRPHSAFAGKTPYETLRERLQ